MANEQRVIQPLVIMQPPPDPEASYDDAEANRFIEDTTVPSGLTYQEWMAQRRPLPPAPEAQADDVPQI